MCVVCGKKLCCSASKHFILAVDNDKKYKYRDPSICPD